MSSVLRPAHASSAQFKSGSTCPSAARRSLGRDAPPRTVRTAPLLTRSLRRELCGVWYRCNRRRFDSRVRVRTSPFRPVPPQIRKSVKHSLETFAFPSVLKLRAASKLPLISHDEKDTIEHS